MQLLFEGGDYSRAESIRRNMVVINVGSSKGQGTILTYSMVHRFYLQVVGSGNNMYAMS